MNNDRFKFRVWDIGNKCYIDYPALSQNGCLIDEKDFYLEDGQFIIEQCTGLKDNSNTLIFENDLVKNDWSEQIWLIKYSNKHCCLILSGKNEERFINSDDEYQIIGNTHEVKE